MFGTNKNWRKKERARVTLFFEGGDKLEGFVFRLTDERTSDLMNDGRAHLPFEDLQGRIHIVTKTIVRSMMIRDEDPKKSREQESEDERSRNADPFALLGVDERVSPAELKRVYHQLVRAYHPDRLALADLPDDLTGFANRRLAEINEAYERITRQWTRAK